MNYWLAKTNLNDNKNKMHRNTNFYNTNHFSKTGLRSYNQFNIEASQIDIKDSNLKLLISRLIKSNQELNDKLQIEKQSNFQYAQLKRRLEDEIRRLQFELERIATYDTLSHREIEVKRNQMIMDSNKLQTQLDSYLEENKKIRGDLRKWMNQCEQLGKQKEDLINQNVILLNQIADLKAKIIASQDQIYEYQRQLKQMSHRNQLNFYSSEQQQNKSGRINKQVINPQRDARYRQNESAHGYQSPKARIGEKFFRNGQLSTNPSENKISLSSPDIFRSQRKLQEQFEKINQEFYQENAEISPRSFNNKFIQQNLQNFQPHKINNEIKNNQANPSFISINQVRTIKESPSVMTYTNRESPMLQMLKFNALERKRQAQMQSAQQENNNSAFLQTYQKKQLKEQVSKLRDELIQDLLNKDYCQSIEKAEQKKRNSLKLFIQSMSLKLDTLDQMARNYLQARSMLAESCPTLRLKWEPFNPHTNSSQAGTQSQLIAKNTVNLSQIYQSIKQNSKKEKSIAGQYLALFRYLTLLNKLQNEVDPLLIDCIKHSALKQIYRIKRSRDGESLATEE